MKKAFTLIELIFVIIIIGILGRTVVVAFHDYGFKTNLSKSRAMFETLDSYIRANSFKQMVMGNGLHMPYFRLTDVFKTYKERTYGLKEISTGSTPNVRIFRYYFDDKKYISYQFLENDVVLSGCAYSGFKKSEEIQIKDKFLNCNAE